MSPWLELQKLPIFRPAHFRLVVVLFFIAFQLCACGPDKNHNVLTGDRVPSGNFIAESDLDYLQLANFERSGDMLSTTAILSHELPATDLNIDPLSPLMWSENLGQTSGASNGLIGKSVTGGSRVNLAADLMTEIHFEVLSADRLRYVVSNISLSNQETLGERSGFLIKADAPSLFRKLETLSKPHALSVRSPTKGWHAQSLAAQPLWNWNESLITEEFCLRSFLNSCADLISIGFLPDPALPVPPAARLPQAATPASPLQSRPPGPPAHAVSSIPERIPDLIRPTAALAPARDELGDFFDYLLERWLLWETHESVTNQDLNVHLNEDLKVYLSSNILTKFFDHGQIVSTSKYVDESEESFQVHESNGKTTALSRKANPLLQDRVFLAYVLPHCVRAPEAWIEDYRIDWRIPFFSKPEYAQKIGVDIPLSRWIYERSGIELQDISAADPSDADIVTDLEVPPQSRFKIQVILSDFFDPETQKMKTPQLHYNMKATDGSSYDPTNDVLAIDVLRRLKELAICEATPVSL